MMDEFKISAVRRVDGEKGLLAFVDVTFFEILVVRNFRIISPRDGKQIFCGLPVQSYFDKGIGKINRRTVIKLPEELKAKVYESILGEWGRIQELKFKTGGGQ